MNEIETEFRDRFGEDAGAFTVRAPGRVNLIGEHIDYNDGFVLPMAISLRLEMRIRPRTDGRVELTATNFNESLGFSLDDISRQNNWIDYVQGVAAELQLLGIETQGFEGVIHSTIPIASGLSSSAAIEVAAALAFVKMAQIDMPAPDIAVLCQRAENQFVGVNSGIMDQMAVAACRAGHTLLIDCRSLALEQVPLELTEHVIVVTDSGAPRELAASAYNERRAQCEQALQILRQAMPGVRSFRDISPGDFELHCHLLPPVIENRARHVMYEIARTLSAVALLRAGDMPGFGRAMNESHDSLSRLYEVSSTELDWLTDWSRRQPGVLGSRLTGAGFGGCTVTLIEKNAVPDFINKLPGAYGFTMHRHARCWVCQAEDGAGIVR